MTSHTSSRLYTEAFIASRSDATVDEQAFFRSRLDAMRIRVLPLVGRILTDMPGYTVHDISHLDALWETASLVAEDSLSLNPPEAFVFGGAVLLHDAAMTLAAYPGGIAEVSSLPEWRDFQAIHESHSDRAILTEVLRTLHARTAAQLATQGWPDASFPTESQYLIEESDLRHFYGPTIGLIAHSHWWSPGKVESELNRYLGAMPPNTSNDVDMLKLAGLLRVADATHLDRRRAPPFIRALDRPEGISALHWQFQGRLAFPRLQGDALQFTAGDACPISEADSWWLGYDALVVADNELRDTDLMLRQQGRAGLRARRVKGASRPSELAVDIPVAGWKPVDTRLHVSDVPRIVETLGGSKLYGDDWWAPLRELLQNAVDAIDARRRLQKTKDWGSILVNLEQRADGLWLTVEDDGVGMSERVLTTALLDFGSSFWRSQTLPDEFPGLAASGMQSIGRFGIGFFSVFMLGREVTVITRRFDDSRASALKLHFGDGLASRPILSPVSAGEEPQVGGTRVEVKLREDPRRGRTFEFATGAPSTSGFFESILRTPPSAETLEGLVTYIAPASDVTIKVGSSTDFTIAVRAGDWHTIAPSELGRRVSPISRKATADLLDRLMRPILDGTGRLVGRAALWPSRSLNDHPGAIASGGFRLQSVPHLWGIVLGEVQTAARDAATLSVTPESLRAWANDQAKLISRSGMDDDNKAMCAEIILELGGNIGSLPIACRGDIWYNQKSLRDLLLHLDEVKIYAGTVEYDDEDGIPQSAFDAFEPDADMFFVPTVTSHLFSSDSIFSRPRSSPLLQKFEKIITSVWKQVSGSDEIEVVGNVNYSDVLRRIEWYSRG